MKNKIFGIGRLILKLTIEFLFGGGLYYNCERVFRAVRHHGAPLPHVFFLGGFAFLLLLGVAQLPFTKWRRYTVLPIIGGAALTVYEYYFGLYFVVTQNLWIWDYHGCPLQYNGLICFKFSLCWVGASLLAVFINLFIECKLLVKTKFCYQNMFR